jgi:RNA polymerase primary sigma factor
MSRRREDAGEEDALRAYLRAIARASRLTPDQERALGERIVATGGADQGALRRLVESNLRFVVSYAKRYRGLGVPFLDLIHEGNLGVIEAARRFDPGRKVKFITYAVWWIRQSILHALAEQARIFSIPQKVSGAAARLRREVAALTDSLDRTPTLHEIADDLDISEATVDTLRQLGASDVSLSDRIGDDENGVELGDMLEQVLVRGAEEEVIRHRLAHQLNQALSELDEKEREVVRLRYGLTRDGEPQTLQKIGNRLHLSRERIRQIECRAKDKLRHSKRVVGLRSYLN